ncbi:MAG: Cysteine desulfurase [Syntrophaceae bacterium PtaU1.Bin231]|nr:MAG: Cysteine desulfurase [Syntrophaceae bacterium PtaB.Bin038]OPY87486.1 MAG: Cysteine desulfurase [Syntrophaceae bacterium PtaU1.Bin231]
MKRIYLDHAATTPTDPEVVDAMIPYFHDRFGNPSSLHSFGREGKVAVETARRKVAAFLGAEPEEVVFTSGGTESNNMALRGVARALRDRGHHVVASSVEHHAVIEPCRDLAEEGCEITWLPVDAHGLVDPADVARAVTNRTILVSVMHGNNEIGTIQPIAEISRLVHGKGVYLHTDAVQTFGHVPFTVDEIGVDLLSLSAHKLYGPKGVGALYVRKGTRIAPLLRGGGQEGGRRASTENVPAIVGLGKAVDLAREKLAGEVAELTHLRDRFMEGLRQRVDGIRINGHPVHRLPGNVSVSFDGVEAEPLLLTLDLMGIACSGGSACSSTAVEASHVLTAIGLEPGMARGTLRFSLGRATTREDIDRVLEVLPPVVKRLRSAARKGHEERKP